MGIRMTVAEAAKRLEMSPMALRIAMRQGKFSFFGEAWQNDEKWTYFINRNRFEEYIAKYGEVSLSEEENEEKSI
jgi:N-acetylglucosamine kinase-like BadF-type ATPase